MEFSVLDNQTLQCIMTEQEIEDYGMDRRTLFQNDSRAHDFFRKVMLRGQETTGFRRKQGEVAVSASFLKDKKLEIIFSVSDGGEIAEKPQANIKTVIFKCQNLTDLIRFCRQLPDTPQASVRRCRGNLFLLADLSGYTRHRTAVIFNLADEYVDAVCYTEAIAAHIREHGTCILEKDAVKILSAL